MMAQSVITTVITAEDRTKFLSKTRINVDPRTGAKQFQSIGTTTLEQIDAAIALLQADRKLLEAK